MSRGGMCVGRVPCIVKFLCLAPQLTGLLELSEAKLVLVTKKIF